METVSTKQKRKKLLFTDLSYINHNYGAQGIALPLIEKLRQIYQAEYQFAIQKKYFQDNIEFSKQHGFNITLTPDVALLLSSVNWFFKILVNILYIFRRGRCISKKEKELLKTFLTIIRKSDCIIDLSGLEFIGNFSLLKKYFSFFSTIAVQLCAEKEGILYIKYTKSYGPFRGVLYRSLVRRQLNQLPFLFIRGNYNLSEIKKLKVVPPMYTFPDISLCLQPESKSWAISYITQCGLNPEKKIVGISPSAVIAQINNNGDDSCGSNHIDLCLSIIQFFQSIDQEILLIPHSVGDGQNIKTCDLALTKKIFNKLPTKNHVSIITDSNLTYRQVRSIIGILDFYITARYHSVASALAMATPVVTLSWHIKYKDILSQFLDNYLAIDCRNTSITKSLALIKQYYHNRQWFDENVVISRKQDILRQIDTSIQILTREINK